MRFISPPVPPLADAQYNPAKPIRRLYWSLQNLPPHLGLYNNDVGRDIPTAINQVRRYTNARNGLFDQRGKGTDAVTDGKGCGEDEEKQGNGIKRIPSVPLPPLPV